MSELTVNGAARHDGRAADALRAVRITRHYTMHAEGSVLVEFGNTKVLCTASVEEKVPPDVRYETRTAQGTPTYSLPFC